MSKKRYNFYMDDKAKDDSATNPDFEQNAKADTPDDVHPMKSEGIKTTGSSQDKQSSLFDMVGCVGLFLAVFASFIFAVTSFFADWFIPWPFFLVPFVLVIWIFIFAGVEKHRKPVGLGLLGFVLAIGLVIGINQLIASTAIPESATSIDIKEYQPFESDSKLVQLPNPASLKLSGSLPRVDGATALVPVYMAFVNATYPKNTPLTTLDSPVQYSNTIYGYESLIDGQTDIMFAAYPSKEQLADAGATSKEMEFTPIGREGFVFFVNENNPVQNLTSQQIKDIYSGKITNWSQVGGENTDIVPYQRNEGSGSQSTFLKFMGDQQVLNPPTKEERVMQSMDSVVVKVADDYHNFPGAIGFSFRYFTQEMMQDYPVKLLNVDGIEPTIDNIADNSYPLSSEFYAITIADKSEDSSYISPREVNVKLFIKWILSDEGQYIIRETGYVPISSKTS